MAIRTIIPQILIVLTICFLADSISAQSCEVSENAVLTNSAGWEIPDLTRFDKNPAIVKDWDNIVVSAQIYDRRESVDIDLYQFFIDEKCDQKVFTQKVSIHSVTSFSASGKIFGYRIYYQPFWDNIAFSKSRKGKLYKSSYRSYAGSIRRFDYLDTDGDGKFETRRQTINNSAPTVPLWAKETK